MIKVLMNILISQSQNLKIILKKLTYDPKDFLLLACVLLFPQTPIILIQSLQTKSCGSYLNPLPFNITQIPLEQNTSSFTDKINSTSLSINSQPTNQSRPLYRQKKYDSPPLIKTQNHQNLFPLYKITQFELVPKHFPPHPPLTSFDFFLTTFFPSPNSPPSLVFLCLSSCICNRCTTIL